MQSFTFHTPTEIVFGRNAEDSAPALVKKYNGTRVMLVYGGSSAVKSGLLEKIESQLKQAGIITLLFGGVKPNPTLEHVREGIKNALDFKADMFLAVGGGSVIDSAKAIAHGTANPDTDVWQFWLRAVPLEKSLPIGVILTISAAGSETSSSAVITNQETGEKRGLPTELNRPCFACMNPELTFTLPPHQIAYGIVDIMMHTLDRYFTKIEGNDFTDEVAEAVLRVVIKNGRVAMKNPYDYHSMSELMWCGSLSHNGITGLGFTPDFAVHQLGHELSGKFDLPHGASLSTMWGSWANYTYMEKPERFARYARKVWGIETAGTDAAAREGIAATVDYFKSLNMPTKFSETPMGIQPEPVIAELALRCSFYEKRLVGQFKLLDRNDLHNIYSLANV